ncbi:unnamed protein product [Zymoseptoria tritici ST99CH_1A5]|uniref:CID domain-containing protein n=2 Tax=Zymoseptoria tritici TaxID=1047171 RepID=A0A1Y6LEX4_ZYMTR|nr:unnamed protein product [Zymoseptoria tritici ST99CH_1A5]
MAVPSVNELDGLLSSLNQLKPPGASKTKISTITAICVQNIKSESAIVQSFYRALKKAPSTHKLGALYVIDSVVRQWIEKAKAAKQDLHVEGRGEPGTYPAAVKRVTELMPALFDDIMKGVPEDQEPKLTNMITIWERGNTFPKDMLAEFKNKVSGSSGPVSATSVNGASTVVPRKGDADRVEHASGEKYAAPMPTRPINTPIGTPPRHVYDQGLLPGRQAPSTSNGIAAAPPLTMSTQFQSQPQPQPQAFQQAPQMQAAPASDVNSILAALSRAAPAAPTPSFSAAPPMAVAPPPQAQMPNQFGGFFGQPPQTQATQYAQPTSSAPPPHTAFPPPQAYPGYGGYHPPQPPPSVPQQYSFQPPPQQAPPPQSDPLAQLRGFLPENIINDHQKLIPALQLLQDLQKDGVSPDKWGPVLKAFEEQYQPAGPPAPAFAPPPDYGRGRGRSRSPQRGGGGRGSPVYGSYDASVAQKHGGDYNDSRGANGNGGGRGGRFRQRSPMRNSPGPAGTGGMQPKIIGFDNSLPPNNIKVLSRTLFVGGANGTQPEIQELFERFGKVQTCIANRDKRHAFVKMTTRAHALSAKATMEEMQSRNDKDVMNVARQTKWGVGFGPRECCDYARGESIIPIHKLTEADMKWLLTAEYGGTGGKSLEGGMVLEEPDIEIGAGVSSKAMSKRVGPDQVPSNKRNREDRGGRHGKHNKGGGGGGGGGGGRDQDYGGGYSGVSGGPPPQFGYMARPEPVAVATPPAVPGFGFSLGLPSNSQNTYR